MNEKEQMTMTKIEIPSSEFTARVNRLRKLMSERQLDACFVYGDEYRRENLRYISNYWPLFERGAAIIPSQGEPIVLAAPEGEMVCREMSAWPDIRVIPDFACVTVPDEIDYPQANYTNFLSIFQELKERLSLKRIGIVGLDAMSTNVWTAIKNNLENIEIVNANDLLFSLRMVKTEHEINCLREAARMADEGYKALLKEAAVGKTELQLAAAANQAAMRAGAEFIPFCIVSSGKRVDTIIGRATQKVIENGDMVMAALAVQYEGYVATIGFPFVVGEISEGQKALIDLLIEAEEIALSRLQAGAKQGWLVSGVKEYFNAKAVSQYDLYPPLHGCGVAEAESPYPNEQSTDTFAVAMTVNTDISLFGHPDGSNRIEEGLIVTEEGYEAMSPLVRELCRQWKETGKISV